jgi:hypothetical protein
MLAFEMFLIERVQSEITEIEIALVSGDHTRNRQISAREICIDGFLSRRTRQKSHLEAAKLWTRGYFRQVLETSRSPLQDCLFV